MRKIKSMFFIVLLIAGSSVSNAQNVGINATGATPDGSAMLDVSSTTKGFLPPRVALTATNSSNPVTAPVATGLLVYNTATASTPPYSVTPGYYYWDGSAWVNITVDGISSVGLIGGTSNVNGATVTSGVLSLTPADGTNAGIVTNGPQTFAGAKTFAADPVLSTATASQALFTDANKNVVSNPITGTGNVVMSASPTLTGTITSASQTLSGTLGVGTGVPNASAKLDVSSTSQGFLPPRMTAAQRDAISNPAHGLIIYCTDCGFGEPEYLNNFSKWVNLIGSAAADTKIVGSVFQGGIVFYILQPGDPGYIAGQKHGLIAATSDLSIGSVWSKNSTTTMGTTSTALGTGLANTNAIIALSGSGTCAASVCIAYNGGGYSDWYLPSLDELNLMYNNIGQGATSPLTNFGGFADAIYWTSSEDLSSIISYNAYVQYFNSGEQSPYDKLSPNYVRAIRSF